MSVSVHHLYWQCTAEAELVQSEADVRDFGKPVYYWRGKELLADQAWQDYYFEGEQVYSYNASSIHAVCMCPAPC